MIPAFQARHASAILVTGFTVFALVITSAGLELDIAVSETYLWLWDVIACVRARLVTSLAVRTGPDTRSASSAKRESVCPRAGQHRPPVR